MTETTVHTIEARVHGRYLVRTPDSPGSWPLLVGFHGYGEDAGASMSALERIPGTDAWLLVAVQALHPFYTRSQRVVASWMTREDRDLAIADNVDYVRGVIAAVGNEFAVAAPSPVFAGFSQGGAMAYRAAANLSATGLIVLAADVPPDVTAPTRLPPVLVGRGTSDEWYTADKQQSDLARLAGLSPFVETCVFDGGHEWADAFVAAAGAFLARVRGGEPAGPHEGGHKRRRPVDGPAF